MATKPLHLDVHEQIECAHTLASRFYTDPAILEIEKSRIFQRTWQLVGTLTQSCGEVNGVKRTISDPESFFTADVSGEPIIVVRGKEGALRAFSNVCRHRAGPIALGSGCKNVLRCQYHGWTYTLDGRLIGTPDVEGVEFEGLQFAERRDYIINCNWKVYVDNYLEGYHIPIAHPGLMKEIDYAQYRTDTFRYYSQQFAPIRAMKEGDTGERMYAPGAGLQEALYFWVFPNLMLNIYPGNISTNVIVPLSHERTLTIFEWFFHDVTSQKNQERVKRAVAFSDEVQQEDIGLCENVQRGLRSSTYDRGRYSVKRENGAERFHT